MKPQELFIQYEKEVAQFKLALIQRLSGETAVSAQTPKKRTSNLSMIEAVLLAAGKPLHVNEIIAAIEKKFSITLDRDSLLSNHQAGSKGKTLRACGPQHFWFAPGII